MTASVKNPTRQLARFIGDPPGGQRWSRSVTQSQEGWKGVPGAPKRKSPLDLGVRVLESRTRTPTRRRSDANESCPPNDDDGSCPRDDLEHGRWDFANRRRGE